MFSQASDQVEMLRSTFSWGDWDIHMKRGCHLLLPSLRSSITNRPRPSLKMLENGFCCTRTNWNVLRQAMGWSLTARRVVSMESICYRVIRVIDLLMPMELDKSGPSVPGSGIGWWAPCLLLKELNFLHHFQFTTTLNWLMLWSIATRRGCQMMKLTTIFCNLEYIDILKLPNLTLFSKIKKLIPWNGLVTQTEIGRSRKWRQSGKRCVHCASQPVSPTACSILRGIDLLTTFSTTRMIVSRISSDWTMLFIPTRHSIPKRPFDNIVKCMVSRWTSTVFSFLKIMIYIYNKSCCGFEFILLS